MSEFPRLPFSCRACLPLLLGGLALSACAHTPVPPGPMMAKEAPAMNTSSSEAFRPHDLAEYPEITPEEMGRRFLDLAGSLESFDDLTEERVREVTRLPLQFSPGAGGPALNMHLPESGWYYGVWYYENPASDIKSASLEFSNKEDERADMEPVCGMDFDAYEAALERMGFAPQGPLVDEIGRLISLQYARNDVLVVIVERRESDEPDDKLHHACVESISIVRGR